MPRATASSATAAVVVFDGRAAPPPLRRCASPPPPLPTSFSLSSFVIQFASAVLTAQRLTTFLLCVLQMRCCLLLPLALLALWTLRGAGADNSSSTGAALAPWSANVTVYSSADCDGAGVTITHPNDVCVAEAESSGRVLCQDDVEESAWEFVLYADTSCATPLVTFAGNGSGCANAAGLSVHVLCHLPTPPVEELSSSSTGGQHHHHSAAVSLSVGKPLLIGAALAAASVVAAGVDKPLLFSAAAAASVLAGACFP